MKQIFLHNNGVLIVWPSFVRQFVSDADVFRVGIDGMTDPGITPIKPFPNFRPRVRQLLLWTPGGCCNT